MVQRSTGEKLLLLFAFLLVGTVAVLLASVRTGRIYRNVTAGMEPTLPVGTRIITVPADEVARGDIITFRYPLDPKVTFVQRVVAVGGDVVEIRAKALIVNGRELRESYAFHEDPQIYPDNPALPEPYRS